MSSPTQTFKISICKWTLPYHLALRIMHNVRWNLLRSCSNWYELGNLVAFKESNGFLPWSKVLQVYFSQFTSIYLWNFSMQMNAFILLVHWEICLICNGNYWNNTWIDGKSSYKYCKFKKHINEKKGRKTTLKTREWHYICPGNIHDWKNIRNKGSAFVFVHHQSIYRDENSGSLKD